MVKFAAPQDVASGVEGASARLKAEVTAARESARLKSELVATVSHELRTPLASVLGFAELLLHRDLDEDTRQRYTETILGEARRLTALIDDFLDLEKIEAGSFTLALEPFDLSELLEHQVAVHSGQSASHTLEFNAPVAPLAVLGERDRIAQVAANLLSNAIKYSPDGGLVRIVATSRDGFAHVAVTDSGLGIPADQQARIFTKFFRVDSTDTRAIGGTGLGLSLCHELVAAHGGKIGFETTEGVGTTFWFELPAARLASAGASRTRTRVLVIDDDADFAASLAECLEHDDCDVEIATTGESGLARTFAVRPAIICLNGDLSGDLDGWQVLVRLKANPATAQVPVIVRSHAAGQGTAAALGAASFLPEPCSREQLCAAVARQLAGQRSSVLVVGEDETLRRLVRETLAFDGGKLREAADGLEALTMIETSQPDVLVVELADSGREGFAALAQFLERPEIHNLPAVVLTGRDITASEQNFLERHAARLLPKQAYSAELLRQLVHLAPVTNPDPIAAGLAANPSTKTTGASQHAD